jgi:hypothetical protein
MKPDAAEVLRCFALLAAPKQIVESKARTIALAVAQALGIDVEASV